MSGFQSNCLNCGRKLKGRVDKKYCDPQCKSAYQYKMKRENPQGFYHKVDNQLRLNRKILKEYNKAGKAIVRQSVLKTEGFNPKFFTHYWKNAKGDVYLFVYEYGFLSKKEKDSNKYLLIKWQNYMR
ncbi:hypothetical protein QGM60_16005 [Winogradskyella sp. SYSU M77433]|nr:hypothetical protein [Winogradskyella sp. SYSU M77433]MDH7914266.1 hypothetical protein [Winogradskyella sp. SYSU M77433]